MHVRSFNPADAEFCCHLRNQAFIELFRNELQPAEVTAAVNAYQPADYIRMAGQGKLFIVEHNRQRAGFFYLRRVDSDVAELCLIYIDPRFHGQGLGSGCIKYIDRWLPDQWKKVATLIVDTVIPGYNAQFYQKAGFAPLEQTVCTLSGLSLKALRLSKPVLSSP